MFVEFEKDVDKYKKISTIYKSKKTEYNKDKTNNLRREGLITIREELETLLENIKEKLQKIRDYNSRKTGKGIDSCWKGYEAIGMKMKNNKLVPNCVPENISLYSNPKQVMKNAKKYLGKDVAIELSNKKDKKYMVYNPNTKNWVYFGQIGYEDFTKHKDPKRRENYLKRTANMKGDWKDDKYSPNNLSRNILW